MADWSHPLLSDLYTDVLPALTGRDIDAITLLKNPASNVPVGTMAYDRSFDLFKEWSGTAFVNKRLSIAGGGTGADNATQARINLGLGSMATQNSNAVSITGGTISGVAFDANAITAGIVALARGGTGASLALGGAGSFLQSNGSSVGFGVSGAALTNLNASAIVAGVLPLAFGGTGSALGLAGYGAFLGSNGGGVLFMTDGQAIVNLNAGALAFGTVPPGRLPPQKVIQTVFFSDSSNNSISVVNFVTASTMAVAATSAAGGGFHLTGAANVAASTSVVGNAFVNVVIQRSVNGGAFLQVADVGGSLGAFYNLGTAGIVSTTGMIAVDYFDNPGPAGTGVVYRLGFSLSGSISSGQGAANLGLSKRRALTLIEYL
jgi:hypothetical protein